MSIGDTTGHLLTGRGLFLDVDADSMVRFLPQTDRYDLAAGEVLLSPERKSQHLYVVLAGSLRMHLQSADTPPIATLGPGECAGETSLIDGAPPAAWVIAAEQTHLMVISHDVVWKLVNSSHAFARNLLAELAQRAHPDNADVAAQVGNLRRVEQDPVTDALTELHNRDWLGDMFRRHIQRSQTSSAATCLVLLDVDRFKAYNDRHGHLAGDNALRFVAESLRRHFRPTDMIARFSGDEFAVLLPDTPLDAAVAVAERVQDGLRDDCATAEEARLKSPVTLSIGVAELEADDALEDLIRRAGAALDAARLQGRDRVIRGRCR